MMFLISIVTVTVTVNECKCFLRLQDKVNYLFSNFLKPFYAQNG